MMINWNTPKDKCDCDKWIVILSDLCQTELESLVGCEGLTNELRLSTILHTRKVLANFLIQV